MAMNEISMSIEESNKIREQLGLALLEEESPDNIEQKKDFVHQAAINIGEKNREDKMVKKLKQHKEAREMNQKYAHAPTLVDEYMDFLSPDELARKAEFLRNKKQQSSDSEEEFEQPEKPLYTGEDLSGLNVEHNPSRFHSGMPIILTLKDSNILDAENDTLVNVNFVDHEKAEINVKNKKLSVHYNPIDGDDDDYSMEPTMLKKYDDEKKKKFVIGSAGKYNLNEDMREDPMRFNVPGRKISLPEENLKLLADYYTPEELHSRLKAPRKRKARSTRTVATTSKIATVHKSVDASQSKTDADDDIKPKKEEGEIADDENGANSSKRLKTNSSLSVKKGHRNVFIRSTGKSDGEDDDEDEEDIRPMLSFAELKPTTMLNPKMRQFIEASKRSKSNMISLEDALRQERSNADEESTAMNRDGLVISASCSNTDQIFNRLKAQQESDALRSAHAKEEPIIRAAPVVKAVVEKEEKEVSVVDVEMEQPSTSGWQPEDKILAEPKREKKRNNRQVALSPQPKRQLQLCEGVLGDEVRLNQGVFSALMLAKNKGYLELPRPETVLSNPKNNNLKAKNYYEEKIRYDELDAKSANRREKYTGPTTPFQDKKDYNPEIKLEYYDELGRPQEQKEAFRSLSHRFHGKSSGKIKCEKRTSRRVKEMEQEAVKGDVAMRSVDKQYSKMKEDKKFCVPLSGKNAVIHSALKKTEKKGKASPK